MDCDGDRSNSGELPGTLQQRDIALKKVEVLLRLFPRSAREDASCFPLMKEEKTTNDLPLTLLVWKRASKRKTWHRSPQK